MFRNLSTAICGAAPVNWLAAISPTQYIQVTPTIAQLNNVYTFTTCASAIAENTVMYITNNNNPPTVLFACDDNGCGNINGLSTITYKFQSTAPHRIYVRRNDCATARLFNVQVQISCQAPVAPVNDEPCGAIDLMPVATPTCDYSTAGTATTVGATFTATQFTGTATPTCFAPNTTGNYNGGDVWFRVTVPPSGRIAIETEELGICAGAFAVYQATGTCGAWGTWSNVFPAGTTQYNCVLNSPSNLVGDPARHFSGLTPGSVLYIRYWERINNEPGTFRICAYEPDPAPGDEPCGAQLLAAPITCNFQGFSLDRTGPLYGATLTPAFPSCGVQSSTVHDMWFRVPVTAGMLSNGLLVNTEAGSLTDMAMAWYTLTAGACPGPLTLNQIACNDNQSATNLMPRINTNVGLPAVGQDVYIRVWASTWGNFSICARTNTPPVNDDPCGAIPLPTTFGGCTLLPATNEVASATVNPFPGGTLPATTTCGGPVNADVWYTIVVPPNGQVLINTAAGELNAAAMQLYWDNGTSCPNLNLTALPVAACNATGMPTLAVNLLPATTWAARTLYLRVWRRTGADGTFSVCSFRTDAPDASCPDVSADSGGPTGNYSNNENFSQTFCPSSPTEVVHLSFSQFNTEEGLDFLEIRDGDNVAAPCLGRFSGTTLPPQFVSGTPGGCLTVRFTSNANGTRPGWVAAVNCVPAPPENQCSQTITDSGGRCGNYANNETVLGTAQTFCATQVGQVPIVNFTEFNLAAGDFVTLFDGNSTFAPCLGTFSGNALPPAIAGTVPFTGAAGTGCITAALSSNGFGTAAGFVANVRYGTAPTLPPAINANPAGATVNSCNARIFDTGGACGNYQDNEDFTITYCPAVAGQFVTLDFQSFQVENNFDRLFIYDGPTTGSPLLGNFTGVNSPGRLTSSHPGGCLTIRFDSDFSVQGSGWTATLSCSPTPPEPPPPVVGLCNSTVYDPGGPSVGFYSNNIGNAVPGFGGTPLPLWTATYCPTPPSTSLNIEFLSFNVEANWDALYIYNGPDILSPLFNSGNPAPNASGNPVLGPGGWWGTGLPGTFTSTHPSGCITLALTTDESVTREGWSALITCNGPPVPPPPPADCVYLLRLYDACGDGWRGSTVAVNNLSASTSATYTLPSGSFAQFPIPVDIGDLITITYSGTGPGSNNNWYTFGLDGSPWSDTVTSSPPPATVAITVSCEIPPAPPEDCVGAFTICNDLTIPQNSLHQGNWADLTAANRGCLGTNESQGIWYIFSPDVAGPLGFTVTPVGATDNYNFAVWGPFAAGALTSAVCPTIAATTPIRCSFSAGTGATGMGAGGAPTFVAPASVQSEGAVSDGWVPGISAGAGDVYLMYISNGSRSGVGADIDWTAGVDLNCTILPVELTTFDAVAQPAHVDVLWNTATERNSAWFDVQRSADGERFVDLGRVAAAGESLRPIDYLFKDAEPLEGLSYYRLYQVDRDGQGRYSETVPVYYRRDPRPIEVYPNPADETIRVLYDMPVDGQVLWRISDASGRVALSGNTGASKGRNGFDIPLVRLEPGTYTLQLVDDQGGPLGAARFVKR